MTMAIEMKVPAVGESISAVTLARWVKKDGDMVKMDEIIAELESDKATFELVSERTGQLQIIAKEGDTIAIGSVICSIEEKNIPLEPETKTVNAGTTGSSVAPLKDRQTETSSKDYANGYPSPAAAKILAEKDILPESIKGTGRDGRITKADAQQIELPAAPKPEENQITAPASSQRSEQREKMSSLRSTLSKRLVAVKNETAMLTTFNEVDMHEVMEYRVKYKEKFKEKYGIGLGLMSFFINAACQALKEFPIINARIEENNIVYSSFVDCSIAVSAPKGLVVPVIRNADGLILSELEQEVSRLANKARENKLSIEEMKGGTFTITNGGVFGSMMSTPIINAPQSAILGMHNIVERPYVINGQILVRPIMYIALSYDHRLIDGRESVGFLSSIKQRIEDPIRLLLKV